MDGSKQSGSGIPRLSKLPISRTLPQEKPKQDDKAATSTSKSKSTSSAASAASAASSLKVAKRAPSAALTRSTNTPTASSASSKAAQPGRTSATATRQSAKSGTSGTIASRAKYQQRPLSTISAKPNNADDEHHDQLSSLDTFRSASRQGSRLASRPEPLEESDQPVSVDDAAEREKPLMPSLADRTIESLQTVPSTPKERRRSSFFNPVESPMGPPPRPASSLSRNGSNPSRPGTSDGTSARPLARPPSPAKRAPASAQPSARSISRVPSGSSANSNRRSLSGGFTSKLQNAKTPLTRRTASPAKQLPTPQGSATLSKSAAGNSKTIASSRPAKPRPALGDAFAPAKQPSTGKPSLEPPEPKRAVSNSSAALRQQIAAAKAAARKEKTAAKHDSPQDSAIGIDMGSFDADVHADPFNQAPKDEKHILRNRINLARMDGKLSIAAMGLKHIPDEVRNMYDAASMEESNVNWAEVVDLTRLNAADNEFELLDDTLFPDLSPHDLAADDQTQGNQFGGLELLDLHGNTLQALPMGLRRMERLTKLDIAHNKLDNSVFDVVVQIKSLKELRIGHNNLTGNLPASVCELPCLETLDLQANRLLSLPEALRELLSLRVLNVSGNQLTALPMDALQQLPLIDLDASSNALIASLFPLGGSTRHPTLQSLNVANNSLAALTFSEPLELPHLRYLDATNNHLTVLPSVEGWTELITLLVGDNKVSELPQGFTSLQRLRNVNFTSNELRLLDTAICNMESLDSLVLASNPLRDKKFLSMNASDIKRDLKARHVTEAEEVLTPLDEPLSPVTVIGDTERPSSAWSVKGKGSLDLASRGLSDDLNDTLGSFLNSNEVRQILLQSNKVTCIPPALWMGQDLRILDLSDNTLSADYLSDELLLPALQELNLSKCRISSWDPLLGQLQAPRLENLNISANRLSGTLPALKRVYPRLDALFANDNKISSISADALRGLHTVNLTSNNIEQLPAELGLLWDEGLRSFEVGSNAFRVPNHRLLEKGTQAVLRWLRDKLPSSEGAAVEEIA